MYESVAETQDSIVYAEVNGFVEKKLWLSMDYLFVVEVYWSDNRTTYVKRNYKEFLQFHKHVTDYFRSKQEKGVITTPVYIPKISGKHNASFTDISVGLDSLEVICRFTCNCLPFHHDINPSLMYIITFVKTCLQTKMYIAIL